MNSPIYLFMEFLNCNFELLFYFEFNTYCKAQLNVLIETARYKFQFIIIIIIVINICC